VDIAAAPAEQDLYGLYNERSGALGVEVAEMTVQDIPGRLFDLLVEEGASIVALPEGGWPQGLHQLLLDNLVACECQVAECAADQAFDMVLLDRAQLGITCSHAYLAETGSLLFAAGPGYGTLASLLPEVQLTLTARSCLYADLKSYMEATPQALPSRLIQVSGPSRTGDIEGTMTVGVHGPRRVIHWILDDIEAV
jgi:L-lactate utilization protein LutC